jgi:hypothetical protein
MPVITVRSQGCNPGQSNEHGLEHGLKSYSVDEPIQLAAIFCNDKNWTKKTSGQRI